MVDERKVPGLTAVKWQSKLWELGKALRYDIAPPWPVMTLANILKVLGPNISTFPQQQSLPPTNTSLSTYQPHKCSCNAFPGATEYCAELNPLHFVLSTVKGTFPLSKLQLPFLP
jgi:hypothetical protein